MNRLLALATCAFLFLLAHMLTPPVGNADSCSTCSAAGQRACCAFPIDGDGFNKPCNTCDSGLLQILGCDGECGFGHCSFHTCYAKAPCGGDGERACCLVENAGPACDTGLAEFTPCDLGFAGCLCSEVFGVGVVASGVCRPPNCGGDGERAGTTRFRPEAFAS